MQGATPRTIDVAQLGRAVGASRRVEGSTPSITTGCGNACGFDSRSSLERAPACYAGPRKRLTRLVSGAGPSGGGPAGGAFGSRPRPPPSAGARAGRAGDETGAGRLGRGRPRAPPRATPSAPRRPARGRGRPVPASRPEARGASRRRGASPPDGGPAMLRTIDTILGQRRETVGPNERAIGIRQGVAEEILMPGEHRVPLRGRRGAALRRPAPRRRHRRARRASARAARGRGLPPHRDRHRPRRGRRGLARGADRARPAPRGARALLDRRRALDGRAARPGRPRARARPGAPPGPGGLRGPRHAHRGPTGRGGDAVHRRRPAPPAAAGRARVLEAGPGPSPPRSSTCAGRSPTSRARRS